MGWTLRGLLLCRQNAVGAECDGQAANFTAAPEQRLTVLRSKSELGCFVQAAVGALDCDARLAVVIQPVDHGNLAPGECQPIGWNLDSLPIAVDVEILKLAGRQMSAKELSQRMAAGKKVNGEKKNQ